jgi:transcription initiation factor TFIID subunit 2
MGRQALPQAMARLRNSSDACLPDVQAFIIQLIKYNDNSINRFIAFFNWEMTAIGGLRYSDDHYRAALYTALGMTITKANHLDETRRPDTLNPEIRETLAELTLALNMDTLKPSYGRVVGIAALQGIYQVGSSIAFISPRPLQMQVHGHLPLDCEIFWQFAQPRIHSAVRTSTPLSMLVLQLRSAALNILVNVLHSSRQASLMTELERLVDVVENDVDPGVRYLLASQLSTRPPFSATNR